MSRRRRWVGARGVGDRGLADDAGSSLVTTLLLFPLFLAVLELVVVGGRLAVTTADVQSAAREAARQASVAAGPSSAAGVIDDAVDTALADKGFSCENRQVGLASGTNYVAGGQVEVEVTCAVRLSDLGLLPVPGTVDVTRSALEPIEKYRVIE